LTPSILQSLLDLMQISPGDRILELDCGDGEASVELAARVPEGMVVALDASDDCVHRARTRARELDNVLFLPGTAAEIPWKEGFFSKALSRHPCENLGDVLRVLAPDGVFYLVADSGPDSGGAAEAPTIEEWERKLEAAGFVSVGAHRLGERHAVVVGRKPA